MIADALTYIILSYRYYLYSVDAENLKSIEKPDGIGRFIEHSTENEKL